ncbi:septation protein A [Ideonella dechloratans]|uniref:septation protein A n=1 Tax=Ideonella dechloratans TaxID=36863 RepID=UPI0035B1BD69
MKLLFDLLPIVLFFATFRYADGHQDWAGAFATEHFGGLVSGGVVAPKEAPVLLATVVVIIATLAQVIYLKARGRKVDAMLWFSLALVVILGGLTIWFHNETFIKWKPSGLYWAFGIALWASQALFGKNLLRSTLGKELPLPEPVWRRLNFAWIAFFALMGLVNLWVAYSFETAIWVDFKLFGATGLMLLFMVAQGVYISRHLPDGDGSDNESRKSLP